MRNARGVFIRIILVLICATAHPYIAEAQLTVPYTFSTATVISSAEMNANMAILTSALNRTGGTITGNIVVSAGITIDGVDLSAWLNQAVLTTSSPTFAAITAGTSTIGTNTTIAGTLGVTSTTTLTGALNANGAVDIAAGLTIGSGNVSLVTAAGKITAISATYFDSLDGTALTGVAKLGSLNTFTAQNDFLDYSETYDSPAISAGTLTVNLNSGTHFLVALNANIATFTVSNVPASKAVAFTVRFTADGTPRTIAWPTGTVWAQGAAPTPTSTNNKRDLYTLITYDGGTTWFGLIGGQSF